VCAEHPFVRGLADGTLPLSSFRHYVAQDAYFLWAFARGYASALALVPDRAGFQAFYELIGGVLEELNLHGRYASRWGADLSSVMPCTETLAYTDFLQSAAQSGNLGDICAAMTPCMRLYAFLGQTLKSEGGPRSNTYEEWIETYASPDFEVLAARLENLLDAYAQDTPRARDLYRRAMELEQAFFTGAMPRQV
jgi:thiaminase/transcriptional activator TenA